MGSRASTNRVVSFQQSSMDVPRVGQLRRKRVRRALFAAGIVALGLAITFGLANLRSAPMSVRRDTVWIDTVRSGPFVREVRGIGTLVPERISWIAARSEGRVEQIKIWPGAEVEPETVILLLVNSELEQEAIDAENAVKSAEARFTSLKTQLDGQVLEREAVLTKARADRDIAIAQVEVNERLAKNGLISKVDMNKSLIEAKQLEASCELEAKRLEFARQSVEPQLAVARTDVEQARARAALRRKQAEDLQVRAGMHGVLQQIPVEVGQQVAAGTNVARVADPTALKAQVRIAETQARDVLIGQSARVDTRNGVAPGRVSRVDPAVQDGTVLVDVSFGGAPLPRGARPDLSVEGTIELERIANAVYVARPAFGQEESTIQMFKLTPDGTAADRVTVQLARGSATAIEIRSGLQPGDRVILSDRSAYENHEHIGLK